jgi:Protein of unknown function (DUF2824)
VRLEVERTFDYGLVRRIMTHPDIYPYMVSDGAASAEDFGPGRGEHLWYILVHDGAELLGMFLCVPLNAITWEAHTMFFPGIGGRRAIAAYRCGLEWLWANSPCKKIVGFIPEDNPRALVVALRGGAEKLGVLTKSISKHGRLLDQTVVSAGVNHG